MVLFKLLSAIILLLSIELADAYFYVPNFMSNLPFQGGMATATRNNNTLLMFGGENATNSYTNNLYQLTQSSDTFNWQILQQNNAPPGTLYAQAVVTNNNNNMYLLGGMTNTTNNQIVPLQNYQFSFSTNTWTPSSSNNVTLSNTTQLPYNRKLFSATYDNQNKIYIYGGALNETAIFSDFYSLDITTQQYTALPTPQIPRYGHTASLLSNGKLVVIGGIAQTNQNGAISSILAPMNQIYVFDTKTNTWNSQAASGAVLPSTRTSHTAVVSK
jgi:N-acetylneuraminic acid mutarotase